MSRQLAEGWGQFLSGFPWDWFVTLTFRDEVMSFRAHRLFARFVREIEKAAKMPIFWFRADEIGPRGGRFHIHALMGNVAQLRRMYWIDRWNEIAGYARILSFDSKRGAAYYCAKYVVKQINDWELSDNLSAFAPATSESLVSIDEDGIRELIEFFRILDKWDREARSHEEL
jgi:hypothetical protein